MAAPTTETAADKLEERRKLSGEIAVLTQQRDLLKIEVGQFAQAKTAILSEHHKDLDLTELKDAVLETIRERLRGEIAALEGEKARVETSVGDAKGEEAAIATRTEAAKVALAPAEEAVARVRGTLTTEATALNTFREAASKEVIAHDAKVQQMRNDAQTAMTERDIYEGEYQEKKAYITKAEQNLSTREEDVGILEDRYARKLLKASPEELDKAGAALDQTLALCSEATTRLESLRGDYDRESVLKGSILTKVQSDIEAARTLLDEVNTEYAQKSGFLTAEGTRLATKAALLKDYEVRLRQKCAELYPEMEITI